MKTKSIIAFIVFLVVLTLPFIVSAASGKVGSAPEKPDFTNGQLELPDYSKGRVCTINPDNDYVIANHPLVLKEERVNAVRLGARNKDYSIKECFKCHQKKENFCDKCHDYAGVQPGCFDGTGGCHNDQGGV